MSLFRGIGNLWTHGDNYASENNNARAPALAAAALAETNARNAQRTAINAAGAEGLELTGSAASQAGALQGLQMGRRLYGQGINEVGLEAKDYADRVKGNLGRDYAGADVARQSGQQRISHANARAGLSGIDTTGVSEQARRQASMTASMANQDYKDKATALYGRNIGAKQQGLSSQYQAGAGIGQANTPGAVANVSSGSGLFGSLICTELKRQGKMSHYEWLKASCYGATLDKKTYDGYLTIARPIVQLMKRSDKFSNLFIGWSKSIAKQKPNLLTKILLPLCWMVGNAKRITKKEIVSFS
ncbi:MAG: hypothetical protein RIQ94_192 [Pseudomonadota bacterium]|jgi:hypothetical protein